MGNQYTGHTLVQRVGMNRLYIGPFRSWGQGIGIGLMVRPTISGGAERIPVGAPFLCKKGWVKPYWRLIRYTGINNLRG